MKPTHRKIGYLAEAVQWTGDNTEEVLDLLPDASIYGPGHIMVRHKEGISTLSRGAWLVTGENGEVKTYKDKIFHTKYEEIT